MPFPLAFSDKNCDFLTDFLSNSEIQGNGREVVS